MPLIHKLGTKIFLQYGVFCEGGSSLEYEMIDHLFFFVKTE